MDFKLQRVISSAPVPETPPVTCQKCGEACAVTTSNSAKNPGRDYYKCNACYNFCGWLDEAGKGGNKWGAQKRPRGPSQLDTLSELVASLSARIADLETNVAGLMQ